MKDYQDCLDLTYELEGLFCLIKERGEATPEDVISMIQEKAHNLVKLLEEEETPHDINSPEKESQQQPEPLDLTDVYEVEEDAQEEVASPEPETEAQADAEVTELEEVPAVKPDTTEVRSWFSINDVYRFKRELFGNSNEAFQDALDVISAMTSMEEVEDYFYHDLLWDAESEEVKAFMDLLSQHLKA